MIFTLQCSDELAAILKRLTPTDIESVERAIKNDILETIVAAQDASFIDGGRPMNPPQDQAVVALKRRIRQIRKAKTLIV